MRLLRILARKLNKLWIKAEHQIPVADFEKSHKLYNSYREPVKGNQGKSHNKKKKKKKKK